MKKKADLSLLTKEQKSKLTRDYEKYPLCNTEKLIEKDLYFLYITLNKSKEQTARCLGCCAWTVSKYLKLYNIQKSKQKILECHKKTCMERYGVPFSCQNKQVQQKRKQTNIEKYGNPCCFSNNSIRQKIKTTILKKYGVDNVFKSEDIKQQIKEKNLEKYGCEHFCNSKFYNKDQAMLKRDKTNLEKYGTKNPITLEEFENKRQQTCLKRYGVHNPIQTKQVQQKRKLHINDIINKTYETKKKNKSFGKSATEDYIYVCLCEMFGENNVERQYVSAVYPFPCDFYVRTENLYIEYQGWWSHGRMPFDSNNKTHIKTLNTWKERSQDLTKTKKRNSLYKEAIKTWTIKDPLKRKIAKENNLNWIEFFNKKQFEEWYKKNERR